METPVPPKVEMVAVNDFDLLLNDRAPFNFGPFNGFMQMTRTVPPNYWETTYRTTYIRNTAEVQRVTDTVSFECFTAQNGVIDVKTKKRVVRSQPLVRLTTDGSDGSLNMPLETAVPRGEYRFPEDRSQVCM